jgi:hypothetical protein
LCWPLAPFPQLSLSAFTVVSLESAQRQARARTEIRAERRFKLIERFEGRQLARFDQDQ